MDKIKIILALLCAAALQAQTGFYTASQYAYGTSPNVPALTINTPNPVTGSQTVVLTNGVLALSNGQMFSPLNTNAPIIVGQGATQETVTPSSLVCPTPGTYATCGIVANWTKVHGAGETIRSATFGLQEAVNAASNAGGGIVVADAGWFALGGTTGIINAATVPGTVTVLNASTGSIPSTPTGAAGGSLSGNFPNPTVQQLVNAQTGGSYTFAVSDWNKLVTFANAGAVAATLPQAGTAGFAAGFVVDVQNRGTGTVTITPTTSTINGGATYIMVAGAGARIVSDGTNYQVQQGYNTYVPNGTGNVPRSMQAKWAEQPVSVKDFHVAADGVTDDSAAIIQAYNAALAGNKRLYFPMGSYAMASPLIISATSDVKIFGDGPNLSLLIATNNNDLIDINGLCPRISIHDLWLGTLANQSGGYGINATGTSVGLPVAELDVSNVTFQNLPFGVFNRYVTQSRYRGLVWKQSRSGASVGDQFYLGDSTSITITDMIVVPPVGSYAGHMLDLDSNDDTITVKNGNMTGSAGSGIYLHNTLGGSNTGPRLTRFTDTFVEASLKGFEIQDGRDVRFSGAHAVNNTQEGYLVNGGTSINIVNSFAALNKFEGYKVTGGTGVEIIGSTATNNSSTNTNTYAGILIASADGARVIGNRSGDFIYSPVSQGFGILITTPTDYAYVIGNTLTLNTTPFSNTSTGAHNWILQPESIGPWTTQASAPPQLRWLGGAEDGTLNCSTTLGGGEFHYSSFTVGGGNTCTFSSSARIGTVIRVTGACTIAGTLTATPLVNLQGDAGGSGGGGGGGAGAGTAGKETAPNPYWATFYAAGGTAGTTSGGAGGAGNTPVSNVLREAVGENFILRGGSPGGAGGSSGPAGGSGGNALVLVCGSISSTGTISSNGAPGAASTANSVGASGGGGGGIITLSTTTWTADTGQYSIAGGPGGSCTNPAVVLGVPLAAITGTTTGTGAAAHVSTFAAGDPTVVTVDAAGSGYNYTPSCAIVGTGGGANTGSGATCVVTMTGASPNMTVSSIAVSGGNAGYGTGTAYTTCGIGGYGGNGTVNKFTIQ